MRNYYAALKRYFIAVYGKFECEFPHLKVGSVKSTEKDILTQGEYDRLRKVLPEKFQILFDILLCSGLRI